jgi:N-acetylglucosamine-6-phosphate deacetylase
MQLVGRSPSTGRTLRVSVANGLVAEIAETDVAADAWLVPGFVDLQVNGWKGRDFNSDTVTVEDVTAVVEGLRHQGVTAFAPTLITGPETRIRHALSVIAAARADDPAVARAIPFVHVEGPHIGPRDGARGAHPPEHVRPPDIAEFERWDDVAPGLIGLVTLSPHSDAAPAYIAAISARGVAVSVGHTLADRAAIQTAITAGASLATHLGNGLPGLLPRHPNPLWSQLAADELTAMLIADGHHVPDEVLTVIARVKGGESCILVSDMVALAGLAPGRYRQPVGGDVELSATGRLSLAGTDLLAGAAAPLLAGVARMARLCGLAVAVDMATRNPGNLMPDHGQFRVGQPADAVLLDRMGVYLAIREVIVAGRRYEPEPGLKGRN